MPRYRNKKYKHLVDYVCDFCKKKCGGGWIINRPRKAALVFCKKKCKEDYEKDLTS